MLCNLHIVASHIRSVDNVVPDFVSRFFDRKLKLVFHPISHGIFVVTDLDELRTWLCAYQKNWLADSSWSTRQSQWRHYFKFCDTYNQVPLPASLDTVLLYLAHMADSFKYVSIVNYLSVLWVLHKVISHQHVDPKSFEIHVTLKGIRRTLGDTVHQARPISIQELCKIYSALNMSDSSDLAL